MSNLESNSHSLVEILPSEWKILLELYAEKKTESTGYYLIENYIKWISNEPDLEIKCLCLDGDWQNDGTFIMIASNGSKKKDVFFNTLSDNLECLTNVFLCLTYKPEDIWLYGYGERLKPAVDAYLKKFDDNQLHITPATWYRVNKDTIATFFTEPPAGLKLRNLDTKDAPTINEIWPHRSEGSVDYVKRLIVHNVSVGAYDIDNKLIAWCLRLPIGSLGLLQVLESHKRLGLGSLMVRCLSKKISELADEVLAGVVSENTPSRKMFERLGFQQIDKVYWTG